LGFWGLGLRGGGAEGRVLRSVIFFFFCCPPPTPSPHPLSLPLCLCISLALSLSLSLARSLSLSLCAARACAPLTLSLAYVRLTGKGNSNSHGARPVHLITTMTKRIRTSRLSTKSCLLGMLEVRMPHPLRTPALSLANPQLSDFMRNGNSIKTLLAMKFTTRFFGYYK